MAGKASKPPENSAYQREPFAPPSLKRIQVSVPGGYLMHPAPHFKALKKIIRLAETKSRSFCA